MGFEPLEWYCRPVENGIWAKAVDSAFGEYTNCAVDSLVISFSHLVLFGLCIYRIRLFRRSSIAQRFRLSSNYYNYMLGLLAAYCTAEPLLRLVMGISIFNLDGETSLAPFEVGFSFIIFHCFISFYFLCLLLVAFGFRIQHAHTKSDVLEIDVFLASIYCEIREKILKIINCIIFNCTAFPQSPCELNPELFSEARYWWTSQGSCIEDLKLKV